MKYLIVIAVLALAWFVWRKQRERQSNAARRAAPPPYSASSSGESGPQEMVRCPVCALHLPHTDAVAGRTGQFCSEAHRQQAVG